MVTRMLARTVLRNARRALSLGRTLWIDQFQEAQGAFAVWERRNNRTRLSPKSRKNVKHPSRSLHQREQLLVGRA